MKLTKHNALVLCAIVIILLVIFVIVSVFLVRKNETEPDERDWEAVGNIYDDLPQLVNVNPETSPALYDFIQGSVGWHWQYDLGEFDGTFYAFAVNLGENSGIGYGLDSDQQIGETLEAVKNVHTIYGEYYSVGERITLPPLGNEISSYALTPQDAQYLSVTLDNMLQEVPQRVAVNDNWLVCLVEVWLPGEENPYGKVDSNGYWSNIAMSNFMNMNRPGLLQADVDKNGWPKDYLQVSWLQPYLEPLALNIDDPFWDQFDYKETFTLKFVGTDDEKEEFESQGIGTADISVVVKGFQKFQVEDNGTSYEVNEEQLNTLMTVRRYERQ